MDEKGLQSTFAISPVVKDNDEDDCKIELVDKLCLPDLELDAASKIGGSARKIKSRYLRNWRNPPWKLEEAFAQSCSIHDV